MKCKLKESKLQQQQRQENEREELRIKLNTAVKCRCCCCCYHHRRKKKNQTIQVGNHRMKQQQQDSTTRRKMLPSRYNLKILKFHNSISGEWRHKFLALVLIFFQIVLALSLDSPVRIYQQQRGSTPLQKQRQLVNIESSETIERLANLSSSAAASELNGSHDSVRNERVRRAQLASVRQTGSSSGRGKHDVECPPNRLIQSLLPPEYLHSPASNQRQRQNKAYCDCTGDLFGWHLTCFAGAAVAPPQQPLRQRTRDSSSLGAGSTHDTDTLPNQLHPAFRAPQLQRQQQQQQGRVSRAARWMGERNEAESGAAADLADTSPGSTSASTHEGFGEESNPAPVTSTTPRPNRTAKERARVSIAHNKSMSISEEPADFIGLPSSSSYTLMSQQLNSNPNSNQNQNQQQHNSMFQTVPVLFSVKYAKNNMIEIFCDQAAPQYKPAMFQGKSPSFRFA